MCGKHLILDSGTGGSEDQDLFFRKICELPRVYKDALTHQPSQVSYTRSSMATIHAAMGRGRLLF